VALQGGARGAGDRQRKPGERSIPSDTPSSVPWAAMTKKLPAIMFYTGDWIQDTRCLSLAARGAWIDLLCVLWRSEKRGELTLPLSGYARLWGCTERKAQAVINELIERRICDNVTNGNKNVTLISRRMTKEEKHRESTRCRVNRFRNSHSNTNVALHRGPSSSSSSSSVSSSYLPPISPQGGRTSKTKQNLKIGKSNSPPPEIVHRIRCPHCGPTVGAFMEAPGCEQCNGLGTMPESKRTKPERRKP